MADDFLSHEMRVHQNPGRTLHTLSGVSLDLAQTIGRLGLGKMDVGKVMQCHDHRAIELQWPQAGVMVQRRPCSSYKPPEAVLLDGPP